MWQFLGVLSSGVQIAPSTRCQPLSVQRNNAVEGSPPTCSQYSMPGTGHEAPAGGVPGISKTAPPSPRERSGVQPSAGAPPLPDKSVEASPWFGPVPSWEATHAVTPIKSPTPIQEFMTWREARRVPPEMAQCCVSRGAKSAGHCIQSADGVSRSRGAGARSTGEDQLSNPPRSVAPNTERGRRISGPARECARHRPYARAFLGLRKEHRRGRIFYPLQVWLEDYSLLSVNPCCRRRSKAGRLCAREVDSTDLRGLTVVLPAAHPIESAPIGTHVPNTSEADAAINQQQHLPPRSVNVYERASCPGIPISRTSWAERSWQIRSLI
jgi:hypothetical protein